MFQSVDTLNINIQYRYLCESLNNRYRNLLYREILYNVFILNFIKSYMYNKTLQKSRI